ncbi:hypothetical protein BJF82_06790 [Kytococcus sp. CUA-901]|nr:hypothetical protein BJF82_06790 [Kytococcus sp. CUA-901]
MAALVVVAGWSVLVAVLLLVAQLAFGQLFTAYIQTVQRDLLEAESGERRMAGYLHGLLLDRSAGKEVRLFGLTEHLLDAHATVWTAAQRGVEARRAAAMRPSLLGSVLVLLATAAATGWAAHGAWVGTVSTTTLVAVVQALAGLSALGPLGDLSVSAARARLYAGRLTDLEAQAGPPAVVAPRAGGGAAALSLRGVTFTYPGAAAPTLRDLSLEVPAGQSVAVVGVNGVGKSTLIKLVAGLHRPDAGTVRVGGADPGTDDAARQRVSVIFQDFARYPLGLRENVLLGAPAALAAGGEAAPRPRAAPWPPRHRPACCSASAAWRCPWTPSWPVARTSPAVSGSASPWPGRWRPSTRAPACWCSTSRPPRWTSAWRPTCSSSCCARPAR